MHDSISLIGFLVPFIVLFVVALRLRSVFFKIQDIRSVAMNFLDEVKRNPERYQNGEAIARLKEQIAKTKGDGGSSVTRGQTVKVNRSQLSSSQITRGVSRKSARRSGVAKSITSQQMRQQQSIKTMVAMLLMLFGAGILFAVYSAGLSGEGQVAGFILIAAGLFLLKTGAERV